MMINPTTQVYSGQLIHEDILSDILSSAEFTISDVLPSNWAETYRIMTSEVSSVEGAYSFDRSPYVREIVDALHPSHPCKTIVIMKGAQLGLSTGLVENGIGWIISENPGPILYLVGHDDLVEKAMNKVENMLDSTGVRKMIKSNYNRAKNNKSGDKDRLKEFSGGSLTIGPTNHKTLRQVSYRYGFIDDFEAMRSTSKESGGTVPLIRQRFTTYKNKMKLVFISTPEVKETSNIEPEYLKGDQRKYHVPCPCCGEFIVLEWDCENETNPNERAGITYQLDENGLLISNSVGYVCQKCGDFFDDSKKDELLRHGHYQATAIPTDPSYTSYHISSLYAPSYMDGWEHYVRQYLDANPPGQPRNEALHQTFENLVLGRTYEPQGEVVNASQLTKNQRPYSIGIIPEKQSIADGNGRIVLVTFGSDLNGTDSNASNNYDDDARLDWEIVAWSESGATYSINQGSIGTFQPIGIRDEAYHNHPDRVKWSYKFGSKNCVWDEVDSIISSKIPKDTGGSIPILMATIDHGHLSEYVNTYIEGKSQFVVAVKGDKDHEIGVNLDMNTRLFNIAKDHPKLYIANVNKYKDTLATNIGLIWSAHLNPKQPANFMNFPTPENGKYSFTHFFEHFESEHKISDVKSRKIVWKKRSPKAQNHFWDCRIYNIVARDIFLEMFFREMKMKNGTWQDYIKIVLKKK